jgi:hypothetical protein
MTPARILSFSLLASGLALGLHADWLPDRSTTTRDGRLVLAVDLHVHSFLGDGAIGPWNLGREARRRNLDAIAITNHNQVFAARLGRWLSRQWGGPIVLAGEEVTHPAYHIIAVGIREVVDWRARPSAILDAIHAQGGLAIAAHPEAAYGPSFDRASLRKLDGAELVHPLIYRHAGKRSQLRDFFERAERERGRPLAAIGSSDFHSMTTLGRCRTFVFAEERSEKAILAAIREGRTVPFAEGDPRPDFADLAEEPALGVGGVLGWLGLLGLVLAGGGSGRRQQPSGPQSGPP